MMQLQHAAATRFGNADKHQMLGPIHHLILGFNSHLQGWNGRITCSSSGMSRDHPGPTGSAEAPDMRFRDGRIPAARQRTLEALQALHAQQRGRAEGAQRRGPLGPAGNLWFILVDDLFSEG